MRQLCPWHKWSIIVMFLVCACSWTVRSMVRYGESLWSPFRKGSSSLCGSHLLHSQWHGQIHACVFIYGCNSNFSCNHQEILNNKDLLFTRPGNYTADLGPYRNAIGSGKASLNPPTRNVERDSADRIRIWGCETQRETERPTFLGPTLSVHMEGVLVYLVYHPQQWLWPSLGQGSLPLLFLLSVYVSTWYSSDHSSDSITCLCSVKI